MSQKKFVVIFFSRNKMNTNKNKYLNFLGNFLETSFFKTHPTNYDNY